MATENEMRREEETKLEEKETVAAQSRRPLIIAGVGALFILALAGGIAYLVLNNNRVYIDTAQIQAPVISLAPTGAGNIEAVYVQEGDTVSAYTPVARVGNEVLETTVAGTILTVDNQIGAAVTPGTPVVTMIDPTTLRVVGNIDEDKGLSSIAVGDTVVFTVDAFGGKQYSGVVDEVSPTSHESDIVFNISDKRQVQTFDVKARFDITAYPELKNGMSARMWVYQ
jgi:multidrug resistance efflux pump